METTINERRDLPAASVGAGGLRVSVLWHARPERIGARAHFALVEGAAVALSRISPVFDDGAPLLDPFVSRSPLELVPDRHGAVVLWPGRADLRYTVGGISGRGGERLEPAAMARGVVLGLGTSALLLLETTAAAAPLGAGEVLGLVGRSAAMDTLRRRIGEIGQLESAVLIRGETGTGKELVARAIHAASRRAGAPFVTLNVAALGASMAPSQLFGHVRGAFTGADRPSTGYFGQADGGTLLLDEIGACPHEVQAQLLRTLQSGEVQPVGGRIEHVDVRVLAATDEDLEAAIEAGRFRAPLMYRLSGHTLHIPPLRTRPLDIAVQWVHHLRRTLAEVGAEARLTAGGDEAPWLTREVIVSLLAHPWPGNSRELAALADRVARACADAPRCVLPTDAQPGTARFDPPPPRSAPPADAPDGDFEAVLLRHDHNLQAVAFALGIGINTVRRRMAALGLPRPRDIGPEALVVALEAAPTVAEAARRLRISTHGLRLRAAELGIHLPPATGPG